MKYISIDLETTCLSPSPKNILMISMVVENTEKKIPLLNLPHFTCFVDQERFEGSAFALGMNGWILDIISGRNKDPISYPIYKKDEMFKEAIKFLKEHFGDDRVNLAGKNAGTFDYQFLPNHLQKMFRSRVIDPGSVLVDWSRDSLMGLEELRGTLGFEGDVTHDARDDALDVIRILRTTY